MQEDIIYYALQKVMWVSIILEWMQSALVIQRGVALCKSGSMVKSAKFDVQMYVLIKEEGGRNSANTAYYTLLFFIKANDDLLSFHFWG